MRHKPVILVTASFSFILLLLVTISVQVQASESQTNSMQTYTDPIERFTINYPSNWEIAPKNSNFPYYSEYTAVVFRPISEPISPLNEIIFSITISSVQRSLINNNSQPSEFVNQLVKEKIASFSDPSSIYGNLNVKLLGNNYTAIGGIPAQELTFLSNSLGTFDMEVYTVSKGFLYHLVFMSPQSKVEEILPQIQQMKESFNFIT